MSGCGHKNPFSHRYCVVCGDALERIACPQCGKDSPPSFLYCSECGYSLKQPAGDLVQSESTKTSVVSPSPDKVDLNELIDLLALQQQNDKSLKKGSSKMSQADIKAMLLKRKKS